MVDRIGGRSAPLAREAILAAMKSQARAAEKVQARAAEALPQGAAVAGPQAPAQPNFADAIKNGIAEINAEVQQAEALPADLAKGDVKDLTEVATRLKSADLTFKFSMQIRNKLLDAYREVMRMQV
ncbi:MAG: flagellar hook-basal body complex protein FliE [Planctomycetota bacterium]|jgi:flagellar hook-basal body complex protein FliE